jgi:predicted CDP-diglyceride synthetase/phosphatidate cytidylyltransferase
VFYREAIAASLLSFVAPNLKPPDSFEGFASNYLSTVFSGIPVDGWGYRLNVPLKSISNVLFISVSGFVFDLRREFYAV